MYLRFRISAVSMGGCLRLLNFGLLWMTEFARFTRTLGSSSIPSSGKILFKTSSLFRDDSRFLSWVVKLWTLVSNFSALSVSFSTLEVVSITLQTYLFTPGVSILLIRFPLMFLLSLGVLMILFVIFKDSLCVQNSIVFLFFVHSKLIEYSLILNLV